MTAITQIDNIGKLINTMKGVIKERPELEIDPPVKHSFSDGVYVREIFMQRGMTIVGKIHKTKHLNIVHGGICLVVTPMRKFQVDATKGPVTFESQPGEQKVVHMLTNVYWSTVHVTQSTDLVEIEEECISKEYDEELINKLLSSFGG